MGLVERGDGRGAWRIVEERKLAEDRALTLDGDHDLVALLVGDRDLHRPRENHVDVTCRVVTMKHDLVP